MCHLRVELDTLSLKTLPSYMFCTPLKKMFYDQLFMLEPVPSVVSYSIFVRNYISRLLVGVLNLLTFNIFNDVTLLVTVRLGRGIQLRPSLLSSCLSFMLMFSLFLPVG